MCRLNYRGLKDDWVPVKLADMLRDLTPGLETQIAEFGHIAFTKAQSPELSIAPADAGMTQALITYGMLLIAHSGASLEPDQKARLIALAQVQAKASQDFASRKSAFDEVGGLMKTFTAIEIDPVVAAQFRVDALAASGVGFDGNDTRQNTAGEVLPSPEPRRILDTEIVALYW